MLQAMDRRRVNARSAKLFCCLKCKEYREKRFIMSTLKEKGWYLVGLSLMLMCLGLLLLHLRRLQRMNQGVAQDYSPGRQNMTHSSTNDATPPTSEAVILTASEVEAASLMHQSKLA